MIVPSQKRDLCVLCSQKDALLTASEGMDAWRLQCEVCGVYIADGQLLAFGPRGFEQKLYLVSGLTRRNSNIKGAKPLFISLEALPELLKLAPSGRTPLEEMDAVLRLIQERQVRPDSWYAPERKDCPLVFARDMEHMIYLLGKLTETGLLEHQGETMGLPGEWRIAPAGWRYLVELERTGKKSNQAFVALSFDPSLETALTAGILPALASTGFKPVLANDPPHNDNIMNKILAEIRRSGLVVADFTQQKPGVYLEVGFAMGLDIPVIRTCRADDFRNLHFDQSQWLTIKWDAPADLKQKLTDHIEATIPGHLVAATTE